jgi:hypothetical protein
MKKYSLFSGRHDLPENLGPIVSEFDFGTFKCVPTPLWDDALETLQRGDYVTLYVTGLTPALTEFMFAAAAVNGLRGLLLFHYDRENQSYRGQYMP